MSSCRDWFEKSSVNLDAEVIRLLQRFQRLTRGREVALESCSTEMEKNRLSDDVVGRPKRQMFDKMPKRPRVVKRASGKFQTIESGPPETDVVVDPRRCTLKCNQFVANYSSCAEVGTSKEMRDLLVNRASSASW